MLGTSATAVVGLSSMDLAMAGPFTREDFKKLVPADKKLSDEWVKSLTARGGRTTYRGGDLASIGMPVGGICAGQLYLGGDGKLWHWDIFNRSGGTGAEHYAKPMKAVAPLEQGFAVRVTTGGKTQERALDGAHWKDVSFTGEYPVGYVSYVDPECPVSVSLEAFSPFAPLNAEDSSLPVTVMEFTVRNSGKSKVEGEIGGWLENAVCLHSGKKRDGMRRNRVVRGAGVLFLESCAEDVPKGNEPSGRADVAFDDFEREGYGDWVATGTAFGSGPVEIGKIPAYQGDVGGKGRRVVNSHASAPGGDVGDKDAALGKLASREFKIERNFITFLIGGGNHAGRTCMNLMVEGKVVLSATGANNNRLQPMSWDVRPWAGKTGQLVIVDEEAGGWGNIGVDDILFSDRSREPVGPLGEEADFGTMGLGLLDPQPGDRPIADLPVEGIAAGIFSPKSDSEAAAKPFGQKLTGSLTRKFKLQPGASVRVTFVVAWYMPNLRINRLPPGRYYGAKFNSAFAVAGFVAKNFGRLAAQTRLWHDTWYDSTLPYWFLDRTFLNLSILATSTCHRFGDGRFYSYEGVGCCEGTCGHVWHYAHAMARVFPELERGLRQNVDFGPSLQADGAIHFRGEFNDIPAIDAQAGTILRALREHQMSADDAFLKATWPKIRRATEWLIAKDGDGDGLIEGNQHNTLDTDWFGPVAWLSGLYLAALLAAEAMGLEAGDREFAARCRGLFNAGQKNLVSKLFDDGYFINRVDAKHLDAINSGTGCEIDQVMGQSWAFQVGLPRVLPVSETRSALRSLWEYNFTPDVGPYRETYKAGRWYAMAGEAGLLMCSFPRNDWDYAQAKGKGPEWAAGYFNECMNGFEYQAAGHMVWEGMVTEGLAVTRAVHDRYHASRRNPWNEIECGDHYVRSMASHGVFIAACGFEYHGPAGRIGFAPRLTPADFKAPFIAAEGWGTFIQQRTSKTQTHQLRLKQGKLRIGTFVAEVAAGARVKSAIVKHGKVTVPARVVQGGTRVEVVLDGQRILNQAEVLEVVLQLAG